MSNYPPERDSAHNSDEDEIGHDEEEDEEEFEEEVVDWTELIPLDEIGALDDGPSTFIVGGFSPCQHLGEAIDRVKYKEDIVVVFPGVYADARATSSASAAASGQALELNEAVLGGLRIYGVPYAREHATMADSDASASTLPKYAAPSKHRVGPWFTWLTAAATATLLTQEGSGEVSGRANTANGGVGMREKNLLKVAAGKAVAATDSHANGAASEAATTTTSGSSVFASAITSTTANAGLHPVFDFPISFVYADKDGSVSGGLPSYKQEAGDEDEMEEKGEDEEDGGDEGNERNNGDDMDDDDGGSGRSGGRAATSTDPRGGRAIALAGCCARAGLTFGALARTTVMHCVVGTPQSPSPLRMAITAASLTEAVVDHCVVFGGASYGVYAFPRAALTLRSTLVEGGNKEAERAMGGGAFASNAATTAAAMMGSPYGGSVIAQLEHRRARAQRLRVLLHGSDDAEGEDGGSGGGSVYVDAEDGVLPRFAIPQTSPTCEVGVMCDDADVRVEDCLVSHTRLGVLLHGGCAGTHIRGLDIRSCTEAGLYVYGVAGAAEVLRSCVRACGRACLLLIGPSSAEVDKAAAAAAASGAHGSDDDGEGDASGLDGSGPHRPVFAQHPYLKSNTFIGAVRVQGEVRSGAVVNNFVFLPKEEKSAAATATAAQTLLAVDAAARRGFTYVGVEGERVVSRAADQAATAR